MSKKSLITSLVLGAVLTLSLGIYTLVTAVIAFNKPNHNAVAMAYTSDQVQANGISFGDYTVDGGNLNLEYNEESGEFLVFDAENKTYKLTETAYAEGAAVGTVLTMKAVATTDDKGSTTTYNVSVYKQGNGTSKDDAFIVANANNLVALNAEDSTLPLDSADFYMSIKEDINLAGTDFAGIGSETTPFMGTIDGEGHKIENMAINIDSTNYADYIEEVDGKAVMSVGFINSAVGAQVNNLALTNASVVVDPSIYETLNTAENKLNRMSIGLLFGYADGVQVLGDEAEGADKTVVSGTLVGFANSLSTSNDGTVPYGIGGIAGVIYDEKATYSSNIRNYSVEVSIDTTSAVTGSYVGGIAGLTYGLSESKFAVIEKVDVNLVNRTRFNTGSYIGGIAGRSGYTQIDEVNVIVDAKDTYSTMLDINTLIDSGFTAKELTKTAGLVAYIYDSEISNAIVDSDIQVYGFSGGSFVLAANSLVLDSVVTGNVSGIRAAGMVVELHNSTITYSAPVVEEPEEGEEVAEVETPVIVVADVRVNGAYAAGYANAVINSNIIAEAVVNANTIVTAEFSDVKRTTTNNTVYTAGFVGYFYATDANIANSYKISKVSVNTTINNGIDMAGLVCYMGNDEATSASNVVIDSCSVVAYLNGQSHKNYSYTHKAAGLVATVYGAATLSNNTVVVHLNNNAVSGKKYGAAMFGGLVARLATENVVVSGNNVSGSAYINDSAYNVKYTENDVEYAYKQITLGGLIGSIASFGTDVAAGSHPVTGDEFNTTYDDVKVIDTTNITITNNEVGVNINVDYVEPYQSNDEVLTKFAFRARAVGSLIGLVMNGTEESVSTSLDVSTNTVTGVVSADRATFTFRNGKDQIISLMGYGIGNDNATPNIVGASFGLALGATENGIDKDNIVYPVVETEPEEVPEAA